MQVKASKCLTSLSDYLKSNSWKDDWIVDIWIMNNDFQESLWGFKWLLCCVRSKFHIMRCFAGLIIYGSCIRAKTEALDKTLTEISDLLVCKAAAEQQDIVSF